jgi:hypothetical protein
VKIRLFFYSGDFDLLEENVNGAKKREEILLQARGNWRRSITAKTECMP